MYKHVSMLLALAMATPVWAQSPAPKAESNGVQVKLVRVAKEAVQGVAIVEDLEAPQRVQLVLTEEAKAVQENRGYLGIYLGGSDSHVSVESTAKGSGAEKAGLKAGDVILRLNKQEVKNAEQLIQALSGYKPGESVAIQAKRGEVQYLFMVKLGKRPEVTQGLEWVLEDEGGIAIDARGLQRLDGLGYAGDDDAQGHGHDSDGKGHHVGGDAHGESHHGGTEKKGEHRIGLIDGRELGLDAGQGHELSEEQMKVVLEHLKGLEAHEGHGGHTWLTEIGKEGHGAWLTAPKVKDGSGCDIQVECEERQGSPSLEWVYGDHGLHGQAKVQLHWSKEAPQCDEDKGACCEKQASSCCEEDASSCCDDGKSQCGDSKSQCDDGKSQCDDSKSQCDDGKSQCDDKSQADCHQPRQGRTFHGQHGNPHDSRRLGVFGMKEIHGMHGLEEIHRLHGVEKMHGRSGMDHEPMIEAMREMTREMQAMRKEMKQLRQQVTKLNKAKATAAKKAAMLKKKDSSKAKSKSKKAKNSKKAKKSKKTKKAKKSKKPKKSKKAKNEHHAAAKTTSSGSFFFDAKPHVVTKKMIIYGNNKGERTIEIIED